MSATASVVGVGASSGQQLHAGDDDQHEKDEGQQSGKQTAQIEQAAPVSPPQISGDGSRLFDLMGGYANLDAFATQRATVASEAGLGCDAS